MPQGLREALETTDLIMASVDADPLAYAQSVMDKICERIADGESLRSVCKSSGMPSTTSVKRWLRENEAFRAQYAHARDDQADHYADEIISIADEEPDPAKARVRVDSRKWVASKLLPKKYGERAIVDLNVAGDAMSMLAEARARAMQTAKDQA